MRKNKIFWLASWPKSGNTLLRAMLSALFFSDDGKFCDFEMMTKYIKVFETVERLNFLKKENSSDYKNLSDIKILSKYWLDMQSKGLNIKGGDLCFLKTHSALLNFFGNDFTNKENTLGFFYIVRDPRDIVISYAKHFKVDLNTSINMLISEKSVFNYTNLEIFKNKEIVPTGILGNWKIHIKSWELFEVPNLIFRYEDIITNKKNVLLQIIDFFEKHFKFKFNNLSNKINNILNTTSFQNMKKLEEKNSFVEAARGINFFQVGKKEQWKNVLNSSQIKLIEESFRIEMKNFGYI